MGQVVEPFEIPSHQGKNHDEPPPNWLDFPRLPVGLPAFGRSGLAAVSRQRRTVRQRAAEVLQTNLGLVAAVPMTDGIQAAPVVGGGKVFVMDGSGVVMAIDAKSHKLVWQFQFPIQGREGNCNNVAAPGGHREVPARRHDGRLLLCPRPGHRQGGARDRLPGADLLAPAAGAGPRLFRDARCQVYAVKPRRRDRLDLGLRQGGRRDSTATAGAARTGSRTAGTA